MSAWRRTALGFFPERRDLIQNATSIYDLLGDLEGDLRATYAGTRTEDEFVDRVFAFADACYSPDQHETVNNAVAVAFYEHLPNCPEGRRDMAERLSFKRLSEMEPLFRQMLGPSDYAAFVAEIERVHGQRFSSVS
jgi:hypothetical protein